MYFIDTLKCYLEYAYLAPLKLLIVKTKIHWHVRGFKDINVFSTYLRHMIHATFIRRGFVCEVKKYLVFFFILSTDFVVICISACFHLICNTFVPIFFFSLLLIFVTHNLFYTLFPCFFSQFYLFKFNIWSYPLFSFVNVIG